MTIDEAIKTLQKSYGIEDKFDWDKFNSATQLSIEALKNLRNQRASGILVLDYKLPGETEE